MPESPLALGRRVSRQAEGGPEASGCAVVAALGVLLSPFGIPRSSAMVTRRSTGKAIAGKDFLLPHVASCDQLWACDPRETDSGGGGGAPRGIGG